ncbi:hypothetical protein [Streptomyces sp. NBC_01014]|uniref:hypothetical protein n=1 Tax=Streptomyces sp. NBC_01014 TaxID=2903719 RepID=UPI00386C9ACE|nr:hypothetical protein OG282_02645 [Streptomyces sp. NBC_01014]
MEQQTGPNSPPVHGAATDPAYVPGLMPAPRDSPSAVAAPPVDDEAAPEDSVPRDTPPEEASPEQEAAGSEGSEPEAEADGPDADGRDADGPGGDGAAVVDGPSFEVSDRRSAIIANHTGVLLRLDDQEAEFEWSEIGAVEFETSKYGRRLTVYVHMPNRHTYQADVAADSRDGLKTWAAQLDAVLDAYFEE